jgi:hypothetical protein
MNTYYGKYLEKVTCLAGDISDDVALLRLSCLGDALSVNSISEYKRHQNIRQTVITDSCAVYRYITGSETKISCSS